ncbi:hypothetical protein P4H28_00190 [Paenibacillus larvae]|nr:hypothetical protein [Paenibacillus larvae]MEC0184929.1 hypothetical protein [Paenibacillus larvae]
MDTKAAVTAYFLFYRLFAVIVINHAHSSKGCAVEKETPFLPTTSTSL